MPHSSNGDAPGRRSGDAFDLDALLHPARAFAHPLDVVRDRDLTSNEKRAILASWASDARALEAAKGQSTQFDPAPVARRLAELRP